MRLGFWKRISLSHAISRRTLAESPLGIKMKGRARPEGSAANEKCRNGIPDEVDLFSTLSRPSPTGQDKKTVSQYIWADDRAAASDLGEIFPIPVGSMMGKLS